MFNKIEEIQAMEVNFIIKGEGIVCEDSRTVRLTPYQIALFFAVIDDCDGFSDPKVQAIFEELKRVFRVEELYELIYKK